MTASHLQSVTALRRSTRAHGEPARRRKLGQRVVNGIRISDAEIEELRSRGYDSEDLVEAIETFLSDLLV